jgi:hypothetical protein
MKFPRARYFLLASAVVVCAASSAVGQAKQATGAPYAENPAITRGADGTYWLSYTLKNFSPTDMAMKLKVARAASKAPFPGWPAPVLGPGNNGIWIWIGEGLQQGIALLFDLDPSGKLTWMFLPPQIAAGCSRRQAMLWVFGIFSSGERRSPARLRGCHGLRNANTE